MGPRRLFTSSSRGDRWGAVVGIVLGFVLLVVGGVVGVVTLFDVLMALIPRFDA